MVRAIRSASWWLPLTGAVVACAPSYGIEDAPLSNGAATYAGGDGGATGSAGPDVVLHVSSATGRDANDGARLSPKATLRAALQVALAKEPKLRVEILICAGTYGEDPLVVTRAIAIRGGYDCSTWLRTPTYGWPDFDPVNATRIQPAAGANGATLTVSEVIAEDATAGVTILDGLSVEGSPASAAPEGSVALRIESGSPKVTDCKFIGAAQGRSVPTGGVHVAGGAPFLERNLIDGGDGEALAADGGPKGFGSVGVRVTAGQPRLASNIIRAGTGVGDLGAVGIAIVGPALLTGESAITKNKVEWAYGGSHGAGIWVVAEGARVEMVENVIAGGDARCRHAACKLTGVHLGNQADALLRNNQIDVGAPTPNSNFLSFFTRGVFVNHTGSDPVQIIQNIVAGGFLSTVDGTHTSVAIDVAACADGCLVTHNTLFTGFTSNASSSSQLSGLRLAQTEDVTITNNLIVGIGWPYGTAIDGDGRGCDRNPSAQIRGNAFVGFSTPVAVYVDSSGCRRSQIQFGTWALRAENSALTECGFGDTSCTEAMFGGFTATSAVAPFRASRLKLRPGAPCAIAQSGTGISSTSSSMDFGGVRRSDPRSAGAWEQDACAAP